MPIKLTSPYPDDRTRREKVSDILLQWIKDNWNDTWSLTNWVIKNDIAFFEHPTDNLKSKATATANAYSFWTGRRRMTPDGNRIEYVDKVKIEFYIEQPKKNYGGRDPRAVNIQKYLEEVITVFQGDMPFGIYEMNLEESDVRDDPAERNRNIAYALVEVKYIADRTLVP